MLVASWSILKREAGAGWLSVCLSAALPCSAGSLSVAKWLFQHPRQAGELGRTAAPCQYSCRAAEWADIYNVTKHKSIGKWCSHSWVAHVNTWCPGLISNPSRHSKTVFLFNFTQVIAVTDALCVIYLTLYSKEVYAQSILQTCLGLFYMFTAGAGSWTLRLVDYPWAKVAPKKLSPVGGTNQVKNTLTLDIRFYLADVFIQSDLQSTSTFSIWLWGSGH